jgi:hypothetical protein
VSDLTDSYRFRSTSCASVPTRSCATWLCSVRERAMKTDPRVSVVKVKGIDLLRGRRIWLPSCKAGRVRLGSLINRWRLAGS